MNANASSVAPAQGGKLFAFIRVHARPSRAALCAIQPERTARGVHSGAGTNHAALRCARF